MSKYTKNPLEMERKTILTMIHMFCRKFHGSKNNLCENCLELYEYANQRLNNCHYGENKPTCEKCPIHCYRSEMREKVRKVMRYAGPRMIYSHPVKGFRHLIKKLKK
ncbi:MAG: nitrous oxide-stimulated promoter family protein [Promethearchaeota archaeon]